MGDSTPKGPPGPEGGPVHVQGEVGADEEVAQLETLE